MNKTIPALICLALFGALAYFGLTTKSEYPQNHPLYAPNQMNHRPTTLPCPPICDTRLKTVVQSVDQDTWLVTDKSTKVAEPQFQRVLDQIKRDTPLVWTVDMGGAPDLMH